MDLTESEMASYTFNIKKTLGSGGFGSVYEGSFGNVPAAIKRITLDKDYNERELVPWKRKLKHENVVRYFGTWADENFVYAAMELCAGTLEDVIVGKYTGPRPAMAEMMLPFTLGLQYLHSEDIVHRDLKPQNILISRQADERSLPIMKLADFGLCKEIEHGEKSKTLSESGIGSAGWRAPECYRTDAARNPRYSKSSDIFSLGCVYGYAFSEGLHPFGNDSILRPASIVKGSHVEANLKKIADATLRSLITRMISKEKAMRPELDEILDNPTLNEALGIRIRERIVAKYEQVHSRFEISSNEPLSLDVDSDGLVIQPVYHVISWDECDLPPQLETVYSAQVRRTADLLLMVHRMEDEVKKKEYLTQIIRRAVLFDVRMPKWLLALQNNDKETKSAIEEAIKCLPEAYQAALIGELCPVRNQKEKAKVLNEMFYWNGPNSRCSFELLNDAEKGFTGGQTLKHHNRNEMRKAWSEDRIPPAFHLAATIDGPESFCLEMALLLLRWANKDQLKQFTMECLFYAMYIANDESIALACLIFTIQDFTDEKEFFDKFPCSRDSGEITKEQSVFVRLATYGWFRVMLLLTDKWKYSQEKITEILKIAFSKALRKAAASNDPSVRRLMLDLLWDVTRKNSLIRIISGRDSEATPDNLQLKKFRNSDLAAMLINELTLEFIPDKLNDEEFQLLHDTMTTWTDKWGTTCCYLFFYANNNAVIRDEVFSKIANRIVATMEREKLEQFLFAPVLANTCVIYHLWMSKIELGNSILDNFNSSERIDRTVPLLNLLEFLYERNSSSFRYEVIDRGETLFKRILKCFAQSLRNTGTYSLLSSTSSPASRLSEKETIFTGELQQLIRLVGKCVSDNNRNDPVARPIVDLLDASHENPNRLLNGLRVLMLFNFVKIMQETHSAAVNEQVLLSKLSGCLLKYLTCRSCFYAADPSKQDHSRELVRSLRYYDGAFDRKATLVQLIDKAEQLLEPVPLMEEYYDSSTATIFVLFADNIIPAAIYNDWLRYLPNRW